MNKVIVDSSAWIEYLQGTEKGKQIKERITKPDTIIFVTGFIVAEVCAKFLKQGLSSEEAINVMKSLASMIQVDFGIAQKTAESYIQERKKKEKFGLADAHVLASARSIKAKILTCDFDFQGIPEAIILK